MVACEFNGRCLGGHCLRSCLHTDMCCPSCRSRWFGGTETSRRGKFGESMVLVVLPCTFETQLKTISCFGKSVFSILV